MKRLTMLQQYDSTGFPKVGRRMGRLRWLWFDAKCKVWRVLHNGEVDS